MDKYKLQVRHHSEIFDSRESAFEYICGTFKYDSLIGEPAIFLYNGKSVNSPNVMLAFGAGDKKFALIDIANVEEKVEKLEETSDLTKDQLDETSNILMSAIKACGLKFDDNKINDKVSYEPNIKDEVLREATSVTEALALLSQFTQEHVKDKNITTKDTKTVTLSYVPFSNGMELSANVKISLYGDSDDSDFNNNIIGVKNDGIYATSNLEYDAVKNTLTFTSSGMKNGVFHDDANKKVIELGEHSIYTESNDGHNIQLVITKLDEAHSLISADIKVSEDKNNILTTKDNKLFVDGVASNIKYQETTVAAELDSHKTHLNELATELQDVIDSSVIKGVTTDTTIVEASKGVTNEGYIIKTNVRLSEDNSIQIANGGLSANVDVVVDKTNNKLILHVGNKTFEQELPGINLVDNIVYDQKTENIIVTFDNNKTATIPVKDLLNDYTFVKKNDSPVEIETTNNTDGSINVDVRLNLRSTDNILAVDNGRLYVSKSLIDDTVEGEKVRAEKVEQTITTAVENLNTTIANNKTALDNEVSRALLKETEIEGIINEHKTLVSNELKTVQESINVLNDTTETNGSILHAAEDAVQRAKIYTDSVALTKANNGDCYTKAEIEAKGYLTQHQDLTHLATKEEVNRKAEANSVYTRDDVYTKTETNQLLDNKTNSSQFVLLQDNVNKIALTYDVTRNVIVFVDGNGSSVEYALSGHTILRDGNYDELNKAIVLVLELPDGTDKKITIPIGDLLNDVAEIYASKEQLQQQITALNEVFVEKNQVFTKQETEDKFAFNTNVYSKVEIRDLLDTKANIDDVYSKDQIDGKKFVNEQTVALLATKEDVANKANIGDCYTIKQTDDLLIKKADADKVYTKELCDKTFLTEEDIQNLATITTVDLKADSTQVAKINVKLGNKGNGLIFTDFDGIEHEIIFTTQSILDAGRYEDGKIILSYTTSDGVKGEIQFPVTELVGNIYSKSETDEKFVNKDIYNILSKSVEDKANIGDCYTKTEIDNKGYLTQIDGATYLTSTLAEQTYIRKDKAVSGREDNAIKLDEANGGFFVSNKSSDISTQWNENGAIENWTVNDAINTLKTRVDELSKNNDNNTESGPSSAEVEALKARVNVLETTVASYNTQIQALTTRINALEGKLTEPQKTDPDVAKALSLLTQINDEVFTDGNETLDNVLEKQKLVIDSGDY